MDPPTHLLSLPNEIILYILRHLDLGDVWGLLQVSRELRYFALDTIHKRWKIDPIFTPATIMKIQCRAALIALERLSTQLPLQPHPCYTLPLQQDTTSSSHDDDHAAMEDLYYAALFMRSAGLDIGTEPFTNVHELLLTTLDCGTTNADLATFLVKEQQLHQCIIRGINACKHKYVLIEDIDIRNRIRATVDVIFHHTVFVSALDSHTLAVMMVRLLVRLDGAFPSYCREITYTLVDHIKAFLEFTGYKLLGSRAVAPTLASISACFDLMGAAFIGKIVGEPHVEGAVQRVGELLTDRAQTKRTLLVDLLEGWLTCKRGLMATDLCRFVQSEIDKC